MIPAQWFEQVRRALKDECRRDGFHLQTCMNLNLCDSNFSHERGFKEHI
jgi:hypothetical protein